MTEPRYVVLKFEAGDRYDFDPPTKHPADVFLERLRHDQYLINDIGCVDGWEKKVHGD